MNRRSLAFFKPPLARQASTKMLAQNKRNSYNVVFNGKVRSQASKNERTVIVSQRGSIVMS